MNNFESVTFLLVDDDEVDREVVRRMFSQLKLANRIVEAGNGKDALNILRGENGHDALNRPFIILLDINMPIMDGHEFLNTIRADDDLKDVVVFVMTTSHTYSDRQKAHDNNVAGYIVKRDLLKQNPEQSFLAPIMASDISQRVITAETS